MTAEPPAPRGAGARIAEHTDVVHPGVAAALAVERRAPALDGVEHVLEPDDRGRRDVRRLRQARCAGGASPPAAGRRPSRRAADRRDRSACRTTAAVRRRRGTATPPCCRWSSIEQVEPGPRRVGHVRRDGAAVSGCHGSTMPSPLGRAGAGPDLQVGSGAVCPGQARVRWCRAIPAAWAMEADRGQVAGDDGDLSGGQPRCALSEGRASARRAPACTRRAWDRDPEDRDPSGHGPSGRDPSDRRQRLTRPAPGPPTARCR